VDTIRVRGAIREIPDPNRFRGWKALQDREGAWITSTLHRELVSGVTLYVERRNGPASFFELSVPRAVRSSNRIASPTTEALSTVERVYDEASRYVDWCTPAGLLRIMRLDTVLDFTGVDDIRPLLRGLRDLRLGYGRIHGSVEQHPVGPDTLYVQPKSRTRWKATLYDKAREMHHQAQKTQDEARKRFLLEEAVKAEGTLRFEAVARSKVLRAHDLNSLCDLDPQVASRLNRQIFRWARYDVEVGGGSSKLTETGKIAEAMGEAREMSQARAILLDEWLGLAPAYSENTLRKYKRLAESYGLKPEDFLMLEPARRRLDYDLGTVISDEPDAT
jgi:hypothetical protein